MVRLDCLPECIRVGSSDAHNHPSLCPLVPYVELPGTVFSFGLQSLSSVIFIFVNYALRSSLQFTSCSFAAVSMNYSGRNTNSGKSEESLLLIRGDSNTLTAYATIKSSFSSHRKLLLCYAATSLKTQHHRRRFLEGNRDDGNSPQIRVSVLWDELPWVKFPYLYGNILQFDMVRSSCRN